MATHKHAKQIRIAGLLLLAASVGLVLISSFGYWKLIFVAIVLAVVSTILNIQAYHERQAAKSKNGRPSPPSKATAAL